MFKDVKKSNIQLAVFSCIFISGLIFTTSFYQTNIIPAELALHHLGQIPNTDKLENIKSNLADTQLYVNTVVDILPDDKNPVFIYPTESTNFLRIHNDLKAMMELSDKISYVPQDSSAFHTGILDIHYRSSLLSKNIGESIPYMYSSMESAVPLSLMLVGSFGLFDSLFRKPNYF